VKKLYGKLYKNVLQLTKNRSDHGRLEDWIAIIDINHSLSEYRIQNEIYGK